MNGHVMLTGGKNLGVARCRWVLESELLELRQQLRNQLHALLQGPGVIAAVRTRLEQLIATLTEQIVEVEAEIAATLQQDAEWAAAAARLEANTGSGRLTAACLVVTTLTFRVCPSAAVALGYAGLAPLWYASGTSVDRRRLGQRGKRRLRTADDRARLRAAQHTPSSGVFDEQLWAAGKQPKVARCGAASKLLRIAWALAGKRAVFDPQDAQRAVEGATPGSAAWAGERPGTA